MQLIINADDLGASRRVNDVACSLMEQGLVTSGTFLANSPFVQEASDLAKKFPGCSFGAHLNITEFSPLTHHHALELLLNSKGEFAGELIRQTPMNKALNDAIYLEFCTQIEYLTSLGIPIGHLDSHQYVHTIPKLFFVLKRVQKTYDIRKVRITRNLFGPDEKFSLILKGKKSLFNFWLRHYYTTYTTQAFSHFELFYQCAKLGKLKHDTYEVTVHPGSDYYGEKEIDLLCGRWRDELEIDVELVNYYDIGND